MVKFIPHKVLNFSGNLPNISQSPDPHYWTRKQIKLPDNPTMYSNSKLTLCPPTALTQVQKNARDSSSTLYNSLYLGVLKENLESNKPMSLIY